MAGHSALFGAACCLLVSCAPVWPEPPRPSFVVERMPPDDYSWVKDYDPLRHPRVSLITVGPGPLTAQLFGETALRVKLAKPPSDHVYSYCNPAADTVSSPLALARQFWTRRLQYELRVLPTARFLANVERSGREVLEQELNLGFAQARYTVDQLQANARPQARAYAFDLHQQNCTTRVRDLLDAALAGALAEQLGNRPSMHTARQQIERLVAGKPLLLLGSDIFFGPFADRPASSWSSAFVPAALQQALGDVRFSGAHGASDLIRSSQRLVSGSQPRVRRAAPARLQDYLQGGLVSGLVVGLFGSRAEQAGHKTRLLTLYALSTFAFALGVLGGVIALGDLHFEHALLVRNQNWLLLPPWLLALPGLAWWATRAKLGSTVWFWTLASSLLTGLVALAITVSPWSEQRNLALIGLLLPIWTGLTFAAHRLKRALLGTKPSAS